MTDDVAIRLLDVDTMSEDELRGFYRLVLDTHDDWSDLPPPDYPTVVQGLRTASPGFGPALRYLAVAAGEVVGFAMARYPDEENTDISFLNVTVHPQARRRGIGTDMLRLALADAIARDRTKVEAWAVLRDGPGAQWALDLGFRQVHENIAQRLDLASVDPELWQVDTPAGYRTISWIDAVPDEFLESFAAARGAMHDAPLGDVAYETPQWTPERVRAAEEDVRNNDVVGRFVAAVDDRDGRIVGFTEIQHERGRDDIAYQGDTAVLVGQRGHGLGVVIKSRMATWLRADCPRLRYVLTGTAASNTHMIRVNHAIGYTTVRTTVVLNCDIAALRERIGGE